MATHRLSILDWHAKPGISGNCFPEPYTVKATNDVWAHLHWIFNNTGAVRIVLYGAFEVPQNYVGTAKVVIKWTTTATEGSAVWDFDYRAVGGDDAESLDQAGTQESVTVTDAAPSATDELMTVAIDLTSANLAPGDTVEFLIARDLSEAADDLAAAVQLVDLLFQYADA